MMKQNLRLFFLTLLCAVFSTAWGETIESNFTDKDLTVGDNELEWTSDRNATGFENANSARGVQFGAGIGAFNLTSNTLLTNITKVEILCSTNGNSNDNSISVQVGSTSFTCEGSATYLMPKGNNMNVIFEGSATTGRICISCYDQNRSIYIKNITVTYSSGSSITVNPTSVNLTSGENSGTIPVTYNEVDKEDAEVAYFESDGTTAATYDWIVCEFDSDGNIEYLVESNTGEARTAYLKVYGLDADANDVYSDLITITQAAPATLTITPNDKVGISASVESGAAVPAGTTISLSLNVDENYELKSLSVIKEDNTAVDLTENEDHSFTFTMPQSNVTVSCLVYPNNLVRSKKYVKVTSQDELTSGTYLIVYEDGNIAFNGGLETLDAVGNSVAVTITNNEIARSNTINAATFTYDATNKTLRSYSGYYIGQTSDANGLASSTTTSYVNNISFENGNANIVSGSAYLRYNSASNQERFRYYKSGSYTGQKAIQLYKLVDIDAIDVEISPAQYASLYYATLNLKVPAGVTATTYTLTAENTPAVSTTYNENDVIPAGEGVILQGDENIYQFDIIPSTTATKDAANKLKGCDTAEMTTGPGGEDSGYLFYVLSVYNGANPGFYYGDDNGVAFTCAPHKVYLPVPIEGGNPSSSFTFDDMNGINEAIATKTTNEGVYTISGVKVDGNKLQKGLYIINGKKVIIK